MRSSRWHAHGNEYLLVEADTPLTADDARALVESADGIVEVVAVQGNEMQIVIWNPDGSVAEMSGNGTRIAARWLAEQAETATVTVQVGPRNVAARVLADGLVEQDLGQVTVSAPVELEGLTVIPVSVGNPHAVVAGEPADLAWIGPLLEQHPHFPNRTNVQVARVDAPGEVTARVWERGVGETSSSGTSAVAVAAATQPAGGEVVVHFPGG
ncbi:MAG: diaminopimelate epimerase, partial [Gaiellaceae bacterium]|nr:diaminopimelate epimerase [Gaiellaceae bacterium]